MSKVSSAILGAPQDLFVSTSVQQADLGALMTTGDSNFYRYALVGASALVTGNLLQSAAQITNHHQLTPVALSATINANTVTPASTSVGTNVYPVLTVALGGSAVTVNQYAGGWVVVSADGGSGGLLGPKYQIISHPAQATTTGTVALTLGDGVFNNITTSAKIDLQLNPYSGVIQNPTTNTATVAGTAVYPTTAAFYGWVQVGGIAGILNDAGGTITVGNAVVPSTSVAGAVKSFTGTLQSVAVAAETAIVSVVSSFKLTGIL